MDEEPKFRSKINGRRKKKRKLKVKGTGEMGSETNQNGSNMDCMKLLLIRR